MSAVSAWGGTFFDDCAASPTTHSARRLTDKVPVRSGTTTHKLCISAPISISSTLPFAHSPLRSYSTNCLLNICFWQCICPTMAESTVALQDEIALLEKNIAELQAKLKDAKARLQKQQWEAIDRTFEADMSMDDKLGLIKVNLKEVLNPEIMEAVLQKGEHLKIYWGTATTGRPHCGYVRSYYHLNRAARNLYTDLLR